MAPQGAEVSVATRSAGPCIDPPSGIGSTTAANRQRYIDQATDRDATFCRLALTRYLIEYSWPHPYSDCGETDPIVLEFDHLRDKRFEISAALHGRNWEAILDEITKCEVVCANCHRRRTAHRRGTLRAILTQVQSPGGGAE